MAVSGNLVRDDRELNFFEVFGKPRPKWASSPTSKNQPHPPSPAWGLAWTRCAPALNRRAPTSWTPPFHLFFDPHPMADPFPSTHASCKGRILTAFTISTMRDMAGLWEHDISVLSKQAACHATTCLLCYMALLAV
jgi:hypothetical protein